MNKQHIPLVQLAFAVVLAAVLFKHDDQASTLVIRSIASNPLPFTLLTTGILCIWLMFREFLILLVKLLMLAIVCFAGIVATLYVWTDSMTTRTLIEQTTLSILRSATLVTTSLWR